MGNLCICKLDELLVFIKFVFYYMACRVLSYVKKCSVLIISSIHYESAVEMLISCISKTDSALSLVVREWFH